MRGTMFLLIKSIILLRGFNNIIWLLEKVRTTVKIKKKIHGSEENWSKEERRKEERNPTYENKEIQICSTLISITTTSRAYCAPDTVL